MSKFNALFFSVFILLVQFAKAQTTAWTVETLPDPKSSPSRTTVSDPDNYIDESTEAAINAITWDLETKADVQFGIVIVNSIGSDVAKQFASRLFNYWKIGKAGKDNGLLLMIVLDQKRWEFETGLGLEGDLTDYECVQLGKAYLVPYFKSGDYQGGILNVVNAVRKDLFTKKGLSLTDSTGVAYIDPIGEAPVSQEYAASTVSEEAPIDWRGAIIEYSFAFIIPWLIFLGIWIYVSRKRKITNKVLDKYSFRKPGMFFYLLIGLIPFISVLFLYLNPEFYGYMEGIMFLGIYVALGFLLLEFRLRANKAILTGPSKSKERSVYETYSDLRTNNKHWTAWATVFFPIPFVFYLFWYYRKCNELRKADRPCKGCSNQMRYTENVIDEKSDDAFLEKGQLLEEQLASRDWDVWKCKSCQHTQVLGYKAYYTSYNTCPKCSRITEVYQGSETITPATYESSGTGKRKYSCKNCGNYREETYTIPKKTRSSSGGSGGGSYGGGGGGSSWGGGRSGGGGGGGSW
ncbi:MAG TPA: TPM domain-containing protein [Flavobacteriales bacterium]|nr:TPM domain-containing protein [Flavobacteriales bacterium]